MGAVCTGTNAHFRVALELNFERLGRDGQSIAGYLTDVFGLRRFLTSHEGVEAGDAARFRVTSPRCLKDEGYSSDPIIRRSFLRLLVHTDSVSTWLSFAINHGDT